MLKKDISMNTAYPLYEGDSIIRSGPVRNQSQLDAENGTAGVTEMVQRDTTLNLNAV